MTNPMFNPQPNYSGVTIQITNPAVYTGQPDGRMLPCVNGGSCAVNNGNQNGFVVPNNQVQYANYPQTVYSQIPNGLNNNGAENVSANTATESLNNSMQQQNSKSGVTNPNDTGYQTAYPAQYYLNNYNYADRSSTDAAQKNNERSVNNLNDAKSKSDYQNNQTSGREYIEDNNETAQYNTNSYKIYADKNAKNTDMTKSQNIIDDIAEREAEIQEEKKNTKETKIVALTDEYIKSLENYLNNPNDEIRLMASKEILTRLDEDKDRYDDAALNALLNKMMQDPNKLVRIAALSAFGSQLASGNDYTVKLLHNIQSNPNSDKEDVLQAADILLKMSAGVEVKNIPNPAVKENKQQKG